MHIKLGVTKICIKYRKHWKSYVSFYLSGQIGLIWAVRNYSKLTTIFPRKTYDNFKIDIQKFTQIRKSWAPLFSNQKRNDWKNSWIWIIKHIFLINMETLLKILDTFQVHKIMKTKLKCISFNYVLPSDSIFLLL